MLMLKFDKLRNAECDQSQIKVDIYNYKAKFQMCNCKCQLLLKIKPKTQTYYQKQCYSLLNKRNHLCHH